MTRAQAATRIVNDNELRVVGLSRSGNHAILNWVLAQATGRACLLNCAEPGHNPYLTARPMDDGTTCYATDPSFDLTRERRGDFSYKDWLIHSYEDTYLGNVVSPAFEQAHDRLVGPSRRRLDVLVLRDPFNLFASRMRLHSAMIPRRVAVRIWKQHAREALGVTRRLPNQRVVILFNQWCQRRDYRQQISERLGLAFTDAGRQSVARCQGGSSFDGLAYDGRAEQMKVLERWRVYADDPDYQQVFDDPQLLSLSHKLFGPVPGTERWVASLQACA